MNLRLGPIQSILNINDLIPPPINVHDNLRVQQRQIRPQLRHLIHSIFHLLDTPSRKPPRQQFLPYLGWPHHAARHGSENDPKRNDEHRGKKTKERVNDEFDGNDPVVVGAGFLFEEVHEFLPQFASEGVFFVDGGGGVFFLVEAAEAVGDDVHFGYEV
mmetsp:Transcript_17875/g.37388  ORF Transcript_17875/g.37388 Transcript_17875/m.37388 type:complete len:159 (-) Transcript_17875:117-593(-)